MGGTVFFENFLNSRSFGQFQKLSILGANFWCFSKILKDFKNKSYYENLARVVGEKVSEFYRYFGISLARLGWLFLPAHFDCVWIRVARLLCCRIRPYSVECTRSRSISEVKQLQAGLVLGWVTAWEYPVPYPFHFLTFEDPFPGIVSQHLLPTGREDHWIETSKIGPRK